MNKGPAEAETLSETVVELLSEFDLEDDEVAVCVCPPAISLSSVSDVLGDSPIALGAQNMHAEESGAYTGEISGGMLLQAGCEYVILGHSERRQYQGETDAQVNAKVIRALDLGLVPIVCIGETLDEREADQVEAVIERQLTDSLAGITLEDAGDLVLAYEPVWAIGTGKTATPAQAQDVHAFIRGWLADRFDAELADDMEILYGGSVKPGNAGDLFSEDDIDGGLIGGASLNADAFAAIVRAACEV